MNTPTTFTLTIDGQEVRMRYTPGYFRASHVAHFEYLSPYEPRRPIPISETGYRSHFAWIDEVNEAASPQQYAYDHAIALITALPRLRRRNLDPNQLTLF